MKGFIESLLLPLTPPPPWLLVVEKLFLRDKGEELKLLKNFPRLAKEVMAEVGGSLLPPFIIILLSSLELSFEAFELDDSITKSL